MSIYTYSSQYRDACQAKEIKIIWTTVNATYQGHVSTCHRFTIPGLYKLFIIFLFLLLCLMYSYCMFMYLQRASWHSSDTLTEVFSLIFSQL